MALNTRVIGLHVSKPRWVHNITARGMGGVIAAGAVASFTTDVPFGDSLRLNVVVHRMTAVAGRPHRAFHVIRRIQRGPPIRTVGHEIRAPYMIGDIPLCGLWEIIVTNFCDVSLLPQTSVYQRDVILREFHKGIGLR